MACFSIFIASSLEELKEERSELEKFIYRLSGKLERTYDIRLEPRLCEMYDRLYQEGRMQDSFNEYLATSDLAVFMFARKAGRYTLEEYEIAKNAYQQKKTPKFYLFVKEGEPQEESLREFLARLDEKDGHYPDTFLHVDTIKLSLTLYIQAMLKDFPRIDTEDGYLMLGGEKLLSLEHIPEFFRNDSVQELRRELEKLEVRYIQVEQSIARGSTPSLEEEYRRLKLQRDKIIASISQLQRDIFEMSMNMYSDTVHGRISARQQEAYRVFKAGDLDGCLAILAEEKVTAEFEETQARLEELQKENAVKYIREQTMAIKVLHLTIQDPDRFEKIGQRFRKVIPVVRRYRVQTFVLYYYAVFLYSRRRFREALQAAQELRALFVEGGEKMKPLQSGKLHNFLGTLHYLQGEYPQSEACFREVEKLGLALERSDPGVAGPGLARVYNNLALIRWMLGDMTQVEPLLRESVRRFREALQTHEEPEQYRLDVADGMKSIGYLLAVTGRPEEAEDACDEALSLFSQCMARDDRYIVTAKMAELHCCCAAVSLLQGEVSQAKRELRRGMAQLEDISAVYPEHYRYDRAVFLAGMGRVLSLKEDPEAQKHFAEALALLRSLDEDHPGIYGQDITYVEQRMAGTQEVPWERSSLLKRYILGLSV